MILIERRRPREILRILNFKMEQTAGTVTELRGYPIARTFHHNMKSMEVKTKT